MPCGFYGCQLNLSTQTDNPEVSQKMKSPVLKLPREDLEMVFEIYLSITVDVQALKETA